MCSTAVDYLTDKAAELDGIFTEISSDVVQATIQLGDHESFFRLIRERSKSTNQTVSQVMEGYSHLKPVELAICHERLAIVEWLVTECHANPLEKRTINVDGQVEYELQLPAMDLLLDLVNRPKHSRAYA